MSSILLVDADRDSRLTMLELLESRGMSVTTVSTINAAVDELKRTVFPCVITGDVLTDGSVFDLLLSSRSRAVEQLIVVTSDQGLKQWGKSALNGRMRVISRPVDPNDILRSINMLSGGKTIRRKRKRKSRVEGAGFGLMLGNSQAMQETYNLIAKIAFTDATVLICGESGTGKELVAHSLHERSDRKEKPFVAINCGAIPENLVESELFGHEKGSFTGAERMRKGVFERAHRGTLFLDEITEMSADMQVRLLRVLESGSLNRVGGEDEIKVDVRVIAATNRDMQETVEEGQFREDLMYRLAVFPISLAPLRERDRDVILLANHFLSIHNKKDNTDKRLDSDGEKRLLAYHWPGNVRQLRNMVHRAYILEGDEISMNTLSHFALEQLSCDFTPGPETRVEAKELEADDLDKPEIPTCHACENDESCDIHAPKSQMEQSSSKALAGDSEEDEVTVAVGLSIADVEEKLIRTTLGYYEGDKKKTASVLGVSLKTLYNRLNEYETVD